MSKPPALTFQQVREQLASRCPGTRAGARHSACPPAPEPGLPPPAPPREETYESFRTGLDYQTVYKMLWVDNPDSSTWRNKSPRAVLRLWGKLKRDLWEERHREPEARREPGEDLEEPTSAENEDPAGVPF